MPRPLIHPLSNLGRLGTALEKHFGSCRCELEQYLHLYTGSFVVVSLPDGPDNYALLKFDNVKTFTVLEYFGGRAEAFSVLAQWAARYFPYDVDRKPLAFWNPSRSEP